MGAEDNLYNETAYFQSGDIEAFTELIRYDFGSSITIDQISISKISLVYSGTPPDPSITLTSYVSDDASDWTKLTDYTITTTEQDFVETIEASWRYFKLEYAGGQADTQLKIFSMIAYEGAATQTAVKLDAFVFNLEQKYVLTFKHEKILIYQNDALVATVTATGLLDTLFPALKTTQAEDTMVFTHVNLRTKQMQRSFAFEAYTNDPSSGSDIVLNISDTGIFTDGDEVVVSSSAGSERATINNIVVDTSITVDALALDHTTSDPLVTSTTVAEWTFENFPWQNVPKMLFGSEVITNPAVTLTPSATEGSVELTASGAAFTEASVGQYIDGGGGRVKITEYTSTTKVFGFTIIPFYTTAAIASGTWDYVTGYEDVWSDARGYPTTCMFHEQRLWFGGSKSKPNTIWASRVGQLNNFDNIANYDNDAINNTISSAQIDEIVNIYANRGIQVFTAGAEWIVPEDSLTPNTFSITKNTSNGSLATVPVVDIAGTTLFVEKNGKSLLGFVYTDAQIAYITSSLSLLTDLVQNPVGMAVDYNSAQDVGNFLYMVLADGTMVIWCIILEQKISSPTRFETGGLIKDVVDVAGDTYILVDRETTLYLERLSEDFKTDFSSIHDPAQTITGLTEYIGEVYAYTDTQDYGLFTVANNSITLPEEPTEDVTIGYAFQFALTSNKIAINGQTENIDKRIAKATVTTKDTAKLTFENQTISQSDDVYDINGVTAFAKDCRFHISGESYNYAEILSILLNINYGNK